MVGAQGSLNDAALIALFDAVEGVPVAAQAQRLAAAILPAGLDVAELTLGDRDRLLWAFKRARFGPRALSHFDCEHCDEPVSFAIPHGFDLPSATTKTTTLDFGGKVWTLTVPRVGDLDAGIEQAICADAPWDQAPFRAAAARVLDEADPGMDIVFDVTCAECGHENARGLDVTAFVMSDLQAFALRIIGEVAVLARAFGWNEAEVLSLSAIRRSRYIEMVS